MDATVAVSATHVALWLGGAAFVGLAVLAGIVFSQARELKAIRATCRSLIRDALDSADGDDGERSRVAPPG